MNRMGVLALLVCLSLGCAPQVEPLSLQNAGAASCPSSAFEEVAQPGMFMEPNYLPLITVCVGRETAGPIEITADLYGYATGDAAAQIIDAMQGYVSPEATVTFGERSSLVFKAFVDVEPGDYEFSLALIGKAPGARIVVFDGTVISAEAW